MPIDIQLENLIAGVAAHTIKEGEDATLILRSFVTSEDVENFRILALEGIPALLLQEIPAGSTEKGALVNEMVAILRKDRSVTLYIDAITGDVEKTIDTVIKGASSVEAFNPNNVADIRSIDFNGIKFPADAGVAVLFSIGKRRGFFFDLAPLDDSQTNRQFDVEKLLGNYASYMLQTDLFEVSEGGWNHMFSQQWFPFILFTNDLRTRFLKAADAQSDLNAFLPEIDRELRAAIPNLTNRLTKHALFTDHLGLLLHAIDRYAQNDFISATAIIYPRLEGLLRTLHLNSGATVKKISQGVMSEAAIAARLATKDGVLLLPDRFKTFLKKVYFAKFDAKSTQNLVSRHSVSHGVADQNRFDQKSALLALLILDQLTYFLPDENPPPSTTP